MAHYAADCWDAEVYTDRFGWIEVVGIADRTCYDLEAHERMSKTEFKVFKQFKKPKKIKKKVLVPKMEKLGPTFKENVKEILEKIEALQPEDVKKFAQTGYVEIVVNNKPIRLDKEYLDIKDIEESILGEKITPHVIEPSYGIDRILYCILETSYTERDGKVFLKLKNSIAPIEVAVFPLISKPELVKIAKGIYETLREDGFYSTYDENDSIGRRYARIDEIGVPYAITVDFDTLKDKTVTLRDRDTTEQIRIRIDDISKVLRDLLCEKETFESLKKK
jgi:glycyl-tRNA synthetase